MPQYGGGVGFTKMKRKMNRSRKKKRSQKVRSRFDNREDKKRADKKRADKKRADKKRADKKKKRARSSKNKKSKGRICGCGTHKYTGQESSPRGLGKCEECTPLHVMLRGKDGDLYENKGNRWIKL